MDIIKAMNLKKYYTSDTYEVRALDGVSLTVEEGEFIAVVGTSGCGKTTLMNILGGLDTPDFGGVWIRNTSLKDLNKEERTIFRRRNIGFVFQQYNLIPSLSIRENIVLPMRLDGKEIDVDFFNEIVETLGLKDKLERFPSTLSGGQQQRVSIARALLTKPAIVLADEPTGNLDEHFIKHTNIDRERLDEIVSLILETVCTKRKTIRIAGDDYPAELVKAKFMKLNSSHIEFVFDCMKENTTKIRNIKQYLKAVLFNAPNTIDSYYTALVNHDMYGGY